MLRNLSSLGLIAVFLLLLTACSSEKALPPEIQKARELDRDDRALEARSILEAAEAQYLESADYSFELALLSLKHFDEFFKGQIRSIMIEDPDFKPFGRAVRMNDLDGRELGYILRDLGPAIEILDRTLARDRKHGQAWIEKANCLAEMGEYDRALSTLSNAQKVLPKDSRIPFFAGSIHLHLGELAKASEAFGEACQINDRDQAAHLWHGISLQGMGKIDEATLAFNRVISLAKSVNDEDAQQAIHEVFTWHYEHRDYPSAWKWGKDQLKYFKANPKLYRALAITAYLAEEYDSARDWLPEAIKLAGDDALALALLGQIYTTDGRYDEAEGLFLRSLKLKESTEVLSQLGSLYLEKLEKPHEAITVLERAIASQPEHYLARFQLALALQAAGHEKPRVLSAWEDYLAIASTISHPELAAHEAPFIQKAETEIAKLKNQP